ncbi:anaerobic selenocysteine-containing dehydrogenase/ferredoxin-NADP reductase [Mycobacterium sp. MAA66]|uniref:molybdopterin-dependent oxidoreductase n=1 Tax=Mycobacterium sp. MAA66 TaxID=3156297 RepID=UPI003511FD35
MVVINGYCTLCRSRCGTRNTVDGDQLVLVEPDHEHPTGKAMCMKGRAAPEIVHSPHRMLYPMRRTTPKGAADPGWQRITWEDALTETAQKLAAIRDESGAEAVAFAVTTPSGTPISDSIDWIERFIRRFGSPNTCYGTENCNWHKDFAHAFTFGCGLPTADFENADTIMLWGHNPANTWLAQANAIGNGRAKGAKVVVVDPRPITLAKQADVWLGVRPGTDTALALGLIREMMQRRLYDESFVRNWTNAGFLVRSDTGLFLREQMVWPHAPTNRYLVWDNECDLPVPINGDLPTPPQLSERMRLDGSVAVGVVDDDGNTAAVDCAPAFELLAREAARYTAARVNDITGVEPEQLAAAADLLQAGRRVAYYGWTGIGQHTNATQTQRAVSTLYALTGSFDRIGGNRIRRGPFYRAVNAWGEMPDEQMAKALGVDQRPIGPPSTGWITARDMYRAISEHAPYPVRALVAFGTNLLLAQSDTDAAREALAEVEFYVHCDLFENPSAQYADIVLPVSSPWEHEGIRFGFEISDAAAALIQLRPRMVSPRGESRADYEIAFDLACRLGMSADFFGGDIEAGWNYMLEPLGLTAATLRANPHGVTCDIDAREQKHQLPHHDGSGRIRGFDTETRRVEIYSELLHRHQQPAIATYTPPQENERTRRDGTVDKYPLILSTAKNGHFCHSQHRELASLRKRSPLPLAEIGPGLAHIRGIGDGDWIRLTTRQGAARFVAKITPSLADDVVVAEFGWWQACPELDRGPLPVFGAASSNVNSLISADASDPISGSVPHRSFRCNIELDPLTQSRQRPWKGYRAFRVSDVTAEADDVHTVTFTPEDGRALPDYLPGQHIEIRATIGTEVVRAYSLSGAARANNRSHYRITVRRQPAPPSPGQMPAGVMSSYLNDQLCVGDSIDIAMPSGRYVLPEKSQQPVILMAGGIGITPFISLLESLPDDDPLEIWLLYSNRNSSTHAFGSRISHHTARLPALTVLNHYTAPLPTDLLGRDFDRHGRISAADVPDDLITRRARVYMCGTAAMMDGFADGLIARGMPRFDIFRELFTAPTGTLVDDGKTYTISFTRSHQPPVTWTPANGPILTFGEAQGLSLPSGCRVGECESCAVPIISGRVRYLNGIESDDPTVCLTCSAVPASDLTLDA